MIPRLEQRLGEVIGVNGRTARLKINMDGEQKVISVFIDKYVPEKGQPVRVVQSYTHGGYAVFAANEEKQIPFARLDTLRQEGD